MINKNLLMRLAELLLGCLLILLMTSCSSTQKVVDTELTQEKAPKDRTELRATSSQLIDSAENISPEQKNRLVQLQMKVRQDLEDLNTESLKLRSMLVKNIISPEYNSSKTRVLKSRIRKTESKKVSVMLNAVDEANKILGRETARNNRILYDFIEPRAIK